MKKILWNCFVAIDPYKRTYFGYFPYKSVKSFSGKDQKQHLYFGCRALKNLTIKKITKKPGFNNFLLDIFRDVARSKWILFRVDLGFFLYDREAINVADCQYDILPEFDLILSSFKELFPDHFKNQVEIYRISDNKIEKSTVYVGRLRDCSQEALEEQGWGVRSEYVKILHILETNTEFVYTSYQDAKFVLLCMLNKEIDTLNAIKNELLGVDKHKNRNDEKPKNLHKF